MLGYVFLSGNWWHSLFQKILLFLDSVVYWAVSMCYQLFVRLATFRLFEDSFFSDFASRIYSILGVFMLFYLAYALLNALIDPEKLTGDKGVSKIASNLVISLILLGLVPTIFDYAYRLQNYILSSDIIGAIILGSSPIDPNSDSNSEIGGDEAMIKFGDSLAFTVLNTFVNPDNYNVKAANNYTWYDFKIEVLEESNYSNLPSFSDAVVGEQVIVGSNEEAAITYYGFISTVTGAFLIYILLSFTLDLGVRVIKLAFCQLIAPIPIIMRVRPSKKSTFDKWVKTTLSVFFEVFTRVALMYIAVYFIQSIWQYDVFKNFEGIIGKLAMVVVILGIFAFIKQAPKMLSDMLGIESGNLKLGIGEKLKAGGFFAGGALLGAGVTGLVRNAVGGISHIGNQWGSTHGFLSKGKLIAGGLAGAAGSMIAGSASGMFNAYRNGGKDAKGFGDMKKAASAGAQKSWQNKLDRERYKAVNNGTLGSAKAHGMEMLSGMKEWATGTGFTNSIMSKIKFRDDLKETYDNSYKELFETPDYKRLDELVKDLEAKKAAGVTINGQQITDAQINSVKAKLSQMRADTIHNKREAVAYAAYNLAQFAKENAKAAREAGFNLNGINVDDLVLKGNDVYNRATGAVLSEAELNQIFEATNGVKAQVRRLNEENKSLKQSVAYKEEQKKQAASKKNQS